MYYSRKPYKRIRRRTRRGRRRYPYGGINRRYTTRIKSYSTGIAPRVYRKLTYSYTGQELSLTAGAVSRQVFRINGMYDPDLSGAGHQPYMYDQWSNMYQNYIVYACKVEVTAAMSIGYSKPVYMVIWPDISADITIANVDQMVEIYGSSLRMLTPDVKARYIKRFYRINKIFDIGKRDYNTNPNYFGKLGNVGVGSDPTIVAAVAVQFYSAQNSFVNFSTKLTYYTCMWGRQNVTIS